MTALADVMTRGVFAVERGLGLREAARRMVERGVRFVQVYPNYEWDAHSKLYDNHGKRCEETDQPIAALLADR